MKKRIFVLVVGLLLISRSLFAGEGDFIVEGNVGIGTSAPTGALHIYDSSTTSPSTKLILESKAQYAVPIHMCGESGGYYSCGIIDYDSNNEWFKFDKLVNIPGFLFGGSVQQSIVGGGGSMTIDARDTINITTDVVNIQATAGDDGNLTVGGNVGIGTTSPTAKLHVQNGNIEVSRNDEYARRYDIGLNFNKFSILDYTADPNGNAPRLTIDTNGNVGVGTTDPGTHKLYVAGTVYATGGYQGSDERFKKDIKSIDSPLSKILEVKGVSYNWDTETYKDKGFSEGTHYGVVAQEVEKVLPEIVKEGPDGYKGVAYTELIPVLIEAVKEQQKLILKQQQELEALKTKMAALENRDLMAATAIDAHR